MAEMEDKTARKRLSHGKRKQIRRIKQESRKMGLTEENLKRKLRDAELAASEG